MGSILDLAWLAMLVRHATAVPYGFFSRLLIGLVRSWCGGFLDRHDDWFHVFLNLSHPAILSLVFFYFFFHAPNPLMPLWHISLAPFKRCVQSIEGLLQWVFGGSEPWEFLIFYHCEIGLCCCWAGLARPIAILADTDVIAIYCKNIAAWHSGYRGQF